MKRWTILIVDDEENILNTLERLLRKEGYRVLRAGGAREAYSLFSGGEKIDLMIVDYRMPEINGLELLKYARENQPGMMRIMLTGQADMGTVIDAINSGEIYRFITKPWDDEDLKLNIRLALSHLELEREKAGLIARIEKSDHILETLKGKYPEIFEVERDEDGAVIIGEMDSGEEE